MEGINCLPHASHDGKGIAHYVEHWNYHQSKDQCIRGPTQKERKKETGREWIVQTPLIYTPTLSPMYFKTEFPSMNISSGNSSKHYRSRCNTPMRPFVHVALNS